MKSFRRISALMLSLAAFAGAARAAALHDGSYAGPAIDAYWGLVQVQANVKDGHLASVDVLQFPGHRQTSRQINDAALPRLQTEAIKAQSARVNVVSGATLTSEAYMRSLKAALGQASQ